MDIMIKNHTSWALSFPSHLFKILCYSPLFTLFFSVFVTAGFQDRELWGREAIQRTARTVLRRGLLHCQVHLQAGWQGEIHHLLLAGKIDSWIFWCRGVKEREIEVKRMRERGGGKEGEGRRGRMVNESQIKTWGFKL